MIHALLTGTSYSPIPIGNLDRATWEIRVEYRSGEAGEELYAVTNLGRCMNRAGGWADEPIPSSRDDDWLAEHRFSYEEASLLAVKHCGAVKWNGRTADAVAAKHAFEAALEAGA